MKRFIILCAAFLCVLTASAELIKDGFVEYVPNFVKHTASIYFLDFAEVKQEVYSIPASVQYEGEEYVVTAINESALKNGRRNIICTKIILPPTITVIGKAAFREFMNVKEIVLPPQLEEIKSSTFAQCTSLETVVLPEGLKSIGEHAFLNCKALTALALPSSVTFIGSHAFDQTSIKELVLPEGMNVIPQGACANMRKLQNISIPSAVTQIEGNAFAYCERLSEVVLPPHLLSIGNAAFQGCASLTQISLPQQVQVINVQAFSECPELKQMNFPGGIRFIGREAFKSCANLEAVSFAGALPPTISFSAFDFTKLSNVIVPKNCAKRYKEAGDGAYTPFADITVTETEDEPDVSLLLSVVEDVHKRLSAPRESDRDETLIVQKYIELYDFLAPNVNSVDNVQKVFSIQQLFNNNPYQVIKKPLAKELKSAKTPESILAAFSKYLQ